MMHVGFLTFESPFGSKGGGVASYLRAAIPALLEGGHRVTLITATRGQDVSHSHGRDLRVVPVKLPNAHWYLSKLPMADKLFTLPLREAEWSVEFRRAVVQATREESMDVLEVTELGAWWVARNPVVPVLVRLHGAEYTFSRYMGKRLTPGSLWNRRLQRQVLNHAAAVTSPSRFQAAEVAREMQWQPGRITVVPNVIAPQMLEKANAVAPSRGSDSESPMILYTGRLASVKGTPLLLEAAGQVLKQFPRAEFVLAGAWQMTEPPSVWSRWMEQIGGNPRITWLGQQDENQLAELYRRATIFVMPSHYETFGISCLEAMAFRVPVVATRAGALPEIVEHNRVGLTVAPGDPAALGDAICHLLRNPELRRNFGCAGRERVLSRFTIETVRNLMVTGYERAKRSIQ
ncbi:MAG TPA: glycosyltransferase family 4 protein [Bryobacteraceae bacterium]|jgi:glycosyltransferase involved in cell wall biosynthesis